MRKNYLDDFDNITLQDAVIENEDSGIEFEINSGKITKVNYPTIEETISKGLRGVEKNEQRHVVTVPVRMLDGRYEETESYKYLEKAFEYAVYSGRVESADDISGISLSIASEDPTEVMSVFVETDHSGSIYLPDDCIPFELYDSVKNLLFPIKEQTVDRLSINKDELDPEEFPFLNGRFDDGIKDPEEEYDEEEYYETSEDPFLSLDPEL